MTSIAHRHHAHRHPAHVRVALFWLGCALVVVSPAVGVIPGPGGLFVFAAGLALMLKTSPWAKRRYVRFKRRWPKWGDVCDRGMRRPSARRRAAIGRRDAAAPD